MDFLKGKKPSPAPVSITICFQFFHNASPNEIFLK